MTEKLLNGKNVWDTFWRVMQTIIATGVVGLFVLLWNLNSKVAVIEATMVTDAELTTTLQNNVPPDWFREQVTRIETDLTNHVRQTSHSGGTSD